jgi:hypothetical protein
MAGTIIVIIGIIVTIIVCWIWIKFWMLFIKLIDYCHNSIIQRIKKSASKNK